MSDERTNGLHLPDLSIRNFRGIGFLAIRRLGRVTLLGGRNGVGKTTVLEAVRVHAARGGMRVLRDVLDKREEFATVLNDDHDPLAALNYAALFHGRTATQEQPPITIGPTSGVDDLCIKVSPPSDWSYEEREQYAQFAPGADVHAVIKIVYRDKQSFLWWLPIGTARSSVPPSYRSRPLQVHQIRRLRLFDEQWPVIECESLGPGLPANSKLASYWDSVALTEREDISLQAMRLTGDDIERVALVGNEGSKTARRVLVKLRGYSRPVSLKSLGDGVTRLFAAGLAIANSSDGFLVLDEAENGIHYSVQDDFWRMVLRAAHQHNVQVLATTHSSDCVRGFARAAAEIDEAEGVYVRLDREGAQVRAVEYTEEELQTVAKQGIEVR